MISAIDETTVAARRPVLVDLVLQGGGSHVESRQAFGSLEKRSSAPPPLRTNIRNTNAMFAVPVGAGITGA